MAARGAAERRAPPHHRAGRPGQPDGRDLLKELSVLIVGASGFIGTAARREFEDHGHRVTGTSRAGRGGLVALDLGDPRQVRDAVESTRPDVVLHLAGASSVSGSWDDPGSAFRANASGTAALLRTVELIVPEAQFVLASSAAVYGRPAPGPGGSPQPFTEDQTTRPTSPYGASKAAAEILAFESRARTGLPVTSARLFNQIGPGQGGNDAPVQFARAIARAETAGETSVGIEVGDPEAARDYTDVRDTARALRLITERRATGRLNVCSGKATTLGALIAVLDGLTGLNVRIEADPSRAHRNDVQVVAGSPELLNEKTGWSPRIPLEQSLSALLDSQRAALAH